MDNNINFTGSFLINQIGSKKWNKMYSDIISNKRFFKKDILAKGNVYLATKDKYDKEIADYMRENKIVFSYFPNINLKSGIWNMNKAELENLLKNSERISNTNAIQARIVEQDKLFIPSNYSWKKNDHIEQTKKLSKQYHIWQ